MHNRQIAGNLLNIGAVRISVDPPFTWTSGIKSPVYCDNRMALSHVNEREAVVDGLVGALQLLEQQPDAIAGTATAGIGWAALVADKLKLPMVYVRAKAKEHGAGKQIEGDLPEGKHVVVVEDLISTGGSAIRTVDALRDEGKCTVTDVVAIFTYGFPKADAAATEGNVRFHPLTDFATLLGVAKEKGTLDADAIDTAASFSQDPQRWSENHT